MNIFRPARRWPVWALAAALLAPGPSAVAPAVTGGTTTSVALGAAGAQDVPPELAPVRIVVLVDQSGSLTAEDVANEKDAVRLIVQGEPARGSVVSVIGFASSDGPGQAAVDIVCPPTALDTPQNRQFLADCVGQLRRRGPDEGDGTDHVSALSAAREVLETPDAAGQRKIVYLLSDGKLDVSRSSAYGGGTAEDRNTAARQQVPGLLDELEAARISVWPLGFGQADLKQLEGFATGALQDHCGAKTPPPTATVITGSADLMRAMGAASRDARCTSVGDPVTGELPDGGSLDLPVDIPAIASAGSIVVYKRDPRVVVSYHDPHGVAVPVNGSVGVSRFELTGQSAETESMRVVNPEPGKWTVRLSSPPGVPTNNVSAVAIFQGAVRAVISVNPPSPVPGTAVEVTMQVRGTRGPLTDPAQLQGLTLTAELSGEGFRALPPVELADNARDGQYQGSLTVPADATGRLDFLGSVTGIGVSGDRRPLYTRVSNATAALRASLSLNGTDSEVVVGESLSGRANITNSTGQARTLRLEVVDPSAGTVVSAEPAVVQVPAAGNAVLDFSLRFDPATALGSNQARLRMVEESQGTVVGELLFAREVAPVPTWFERLWWLWTLLVVALAAGGVVALRLRWRGRVERDVRGVRVELRRHGQVIDALQAQHKRDEFRFAVRHGTGVEANLTTGSGGERYEVRRGRGGVTLHGPSGAPVGLAPGGVLDLGEGVELVVRDRPASQAASRSRRRVGPPSNSGPGRRPIPEDPYANT
ncbi:VWA domain-containing protein [Actinokineospora pegani]|uniref:VWA domain-containing protein n=1 Tax=Actinokineospora pegani TaxID=2654637 RepID=UPI0012EA9326|nr:VWA domain-containing protein [Actinokineospora pegani]